MNSGLRTVLFVGANATERGLFEYARKTAAVPLNLVFTRTAEEAINYLNGERAFVDRQRYPMPDMILIDLVGPRLNRWELADWLKNHPALAHIRLCFIGVEQEGDTVSKARTYGRCFFTKPGDLQSCIELVHELAGLTVEDPA